MSFLQTLLLLVLPAVALYAVVSLLAAGRRRSRRARYRPGDEWSYEPVWWTAHPTGAPVPAVNSIEGTRGGADGNW